MHNKRHTSTNFCIYQARVYKALPPKLETPTCHRIPTYQPTHAWVLYLYSSAREEAEEEAWEAAPPHCPAIHNYT